MNLSDPVASNLTRGFFDANIEASVLLGTARTLIASAASSASVTHLEDGTPVLLKSGQRFAAPSDDASLVETVKKAGNAPAFVVFGLGMGHTVRHLSGLTRAPIIVFEPDPGLVRAAFESGPSDLGHVPIVCTQHDLTQVWPRFAHATHTATLVHTPGYAELYPAEAQELGTTLAELVQRSSVNDATHRLRARVWIQDVLANVDLLRDSPTFLALAGKYRGVPAFIVGAGPSLGKNGQHLAEATQKGIVFAVNSSAGAISSYGAEPQVLACMESIDVSHLLRAVPYVDRVVRAFSLTGHPLSLRTGTGPLLPIFEGAPQISVPLQALLGVQGLPVAGSVSTLAFSLAERLGCSPIVFVGQDLAYTGGQAYAASTPYRESRARVSADGAYLELDWCETLKQTHNQGQNKMHEREPLRQVEAWGGHGSVLSSVGFAAVQAWLEAAAIVLGRDRPEVRLVNATEGGARIRGFEETALAELLSTLPERHITSADLATGASSAARKPTTAELLSWCSAQRELALGVRSAARRVRRLAQTSLSALQSANAARVSKSFARLDEAELKLKQATSRMPFVDAWAHADVDRILAGTQARTRAGDAEASARDGMRTEAELAAAIERAAVELDLEFQQLRERLTAA